MMGFLREVSGLLKDLGLLTRDFSADRFEKLRIRDRFGRCVRGLLVGSLALLVVYWIASALGLSGLADAAFFVFEVIMAGVVLLAVLALTVVYEAGQQFRATRRLFQLCATGSLTFFLVVFALSWLPRTPAVLSLVLLGALILSLFIVRYGIGAHPLSAYIVFGALFLLSLTQASLAAIFPETSAALRAAVSTIDTHVARSVGTTVLPSPELIKANSPQDLVGIQFFDVNGPLVFYSNTAEGGFDLFAGPGAHPQTGEQLEPMTVEARAALEEWVQESERRRLAAVPRPAPERLRYASFEEIEFFDRVSGRALVWYAVAPEGDIELFTGPGVHPVYRVELQEVDTQTIELMKTQATESTRAEAAASQRAAEETLQSQEAERRTRYINSGCRGSARSRAVLVVRRTSVDTVVAQTLANEIAGRTDCFKPAFVADGLFGRAFDGDASVLRDLGIEGVAESVVLVSLASTSQQITPRGRNMVKVSVTATARVFNVGSRLSSGVISATESAVGFSRGAAEEQAQAAVLGDLIERLRESLRD